MHWGRSCSTKSSLISSWLRETFSGCSFSAWSIPGKRRRLLLQIVNEFQYFQLQRWLDPRKSVRKQMLCPPYQLFFRVKFYVSDPSKLIEEYTRWVAKSHSVQLMQVQISLLPASEVRHSGRSSALCRWLSRTASQLRSPVRTRWLQCNRTCSRLLKWIEIRPQTTGWLCKTSWRTSCNA